MQSVLARIWDVAYSLETERRLKARCSELALEGHVVHYAKRFESRAIRDDHFGVDRTDYLKALDRYFFEPPGIGRLQPMLYSLNLS